MDTAEVWVIHRDTKLPEVYVLTEEGYVARPADTKGWVTSPATDVSLRPRPGSRIGVRFGIADGTAAEFPER